MIILSWENGCKGHPMPRERYPMTMKMNQNFRRAGFTLAEVMTVVAIIGLLVAISIPKFIRARATSQANACINNLRQVAEAADLFALDKGKKASDAINFPDDLTPYIKMNSGGRIPACPAGGTYACGAVMEKPTCSLGNTVTPAHTVP